MAKNKDRQKREDKKPKGLKDKSKPKEKPDQSRRLTYKEFINIGLGSRKS